MPHAPVVGSLVGSHQARRTGAIAALTLLAAAGARAEGEAIEPFWFGSYGRAGISSDLDGARGRASQIVAFGPRLTEGNYIELDLGYRPWTGPSGQVATVVTLALGDELFHYDGDFDAAIAIRQAYVEAARLFGTGLFVWVGSRLYRGDDIYLFDFWPLDDLNTLGGTVGWRGPGTDIALHVGVNRLDDGFQLQRVPVPAPGFGAAEAVFLDRQRTIVSLLAEQRYGGADDVLGMKVKLYGELHFLPSGRRAIEGSFTETEPLPDDFGAMVGAQLGLWNFGKRGFLNVWGRYATGLAAYDELQQPYGLNRDRRAVDAQEIRFALNGNVESDFGLGVQYGGYARLFFDADDNEEDFDDRQEVAFAVRPQFFWGLFTPGVEASVQISRPNGLNPRTNAQETATVAQLAVIPALSFGDDPGTYTRPQIRAVYAVSLLNDAALALYPEADPRADDSVVHFAGLSAEWWFGRGGGY